VLTSGVVRASYNTSNSHLTHNWITAIAPVGEEWFAGTYGGGVLRLDSSGEWQSFPDLPADLVVNPNALVVTEGRVYVGTLDRGLYVYDRSSRRWSNWTSGLPSANVTALTASRGYLYVGTDNGLVRISEQNLP
jgi:ligand-binding sensor domain-containing protein